MGNRTRQGNVTKDLMDSEGDTTSILELKRRMIRIIKDIKKDNKTSQ
jgi:hypothetical protein